VERTPGAEEVVVEEAVMEERARTVEEQATAEMVVQ